MTDRTAISRRTLLASTGAASLAPLAQAAPVATRTCFFNGLQPVVLTVSGQGIEPNRGGLDAARDRMLVQQGNQFDAAWSCSLDAIASLQERRMRIRIEYDDAMHELSGPLLETVLQAAGLDIAKAMRGGHWITMQAVDGYRVQMPLAQAMRWGFVVATQMDGQPRPGRRRWPRPLPSWPTPPSRAASPRPPGACITSTSANSSPRAECPALSARLRRAHPLGWCLACRALSLSRATWV